MLFLEPLPYDDNFIITFVLTIQIVLLGEISMPNSNGQEVFYEQIARKVLRIRVRVVNSEGTSEPTLVKRIVSWDMRMRQILTEVISL